jgi:hypothetical protein
VEVSNNTIVLYGLIAHCQWFVEVGRAEAGRRREDSAALSVRRKLRPVRRE